MAAGNREESHCERQWLSPEEAKVRLDEPESGKLVGNLARHLTA